MGGWPNVWLIELQKVWEAGNRVIKRTSWSPGRAVC